jgi:8-oxo-dGTP diphosphatase
MQRCPVGHVHAGLWEFPGGKIEAGETENLAISREVLEELDVLVAPEDCTKVGVVQGSGQRIIRLTLFYCDRWRGSPKALVADEIRFFELSEIERLELGALDHCLLGSLARFLSAQN